MNGLPLALGVVLAAALVGRTRSGHSRRRGSRESPVDRAWWGYRLEMYRRMAPDSHEYRLFASHVASSPINYAVIKEKAEQWLASLPLDGGGEKEWLLHLTASHASKSSYYWYFFVPDVIARFDNAAFKGQVRLIPRTKMLLTGPRVVVK
jgi:hypothetical protein